MRTLTEHAIEKITSELNTKLDALLKERLEAAGILGINLIEEASRRFPRIKCEQHENGTQVWYWNDGTIYGLRLVTLEPYNNIPGWNLDNNKLTFGYNIY